MDYLKRSFLGNKPAPQQTSKGQCVRHLVTATFYKEERDGYHYGILAQTASFAGKYAQASAKLSAIAKKAKRDGLRYTRCGSCLTVYRPDCIAFYGIH